MEKQERRLYFRAAMTLLLMLLTTVTAWAAGDIYVGYLDPTAPIGMQRKTVLNPGWVDENTTEIGIADETTWYYVCYDVTNDNRIEVKGTVNLILTDGCNFTVSKGIHVPSGSALNIYAQSVANCGSLTATATDHNAAIGGNGGEDREGDATSGESAGDITIYGGVITTTNGNIGGGDGGNGSAWLDYSGNDEFSGDYIEIHNSGCGGNGGNGNVTIYSGYVWVRGNIGGGKAGTGQDENGNDFDISYYGSNGGGTVKLSWANTSDRIYADYYYGSVTLLKAFNGFNEGVVINDDINGQYLTYTGTSYCVTIGSMPDGVTATADLILDAGFKNAVVGQVVTIGFSGVPDGKVPVVSVTYGANNYEVFDIFDNGDGSFSFEMPDGDATVTASEFKNDIKSCEATVPNQTLEGPDNPFDNIIYKFEYAKYNYDQEYAQEFIRGMGVSVKDDDYTLALGTDYTFGDVTYANGDPITESEIGDECKVEIVGMGDYAGNKWASFKIIAPDAGDEWGDSDILTWAFHDGTLRITGSGEMKSAANNSDYPWFSIARYVETITIGEGVTSIAASAFAGTSQVNSYGGVTSVTLPSTLKTIGENAFAYCTGTTFNADNLIAQGVTIGDNAFNQVGCIIGTLSNNADNTDIIAVLSQGQSANAKVTLSGRTLYKDGNWNTLCLPIELDDFDGTPLEGATVKKLDVDNKWSIVDDEWSIDNENGTYQTGFDNGNLYLYFTNATTINAGKPYLVKWDKAADYEGNETSYDISNPVFTGVRVRKDDPATVTSEDDLVQFKGIYKPEELEGGNASNLYLGAGNNLYWPSENMNLGAFRAYFHVSLSGEQLVREIRLNLDGGNVTGVEAVQGFKSLRVQDSLPTKRIVNGRLIIERNDQLFNANGVRIN